MTTNLIDDSWEVESARSDVVKASLKLAATEWGNGRTTANGSADLDYAHDQLDQALEAFISTVEALAHSGIVPESDAIRMVRQFMITFNNPINWGGPGFFGGDASTATDEDIAANQLRINLILEEAQEFADAVTAWDIVETADAIGDLLYVVYGAAISFGIDPDAILKEVHLSNLTKLGEDGKPIYRESDGKVMKGPNFQPPRIAMVLGLGEQ